MTTDQNKLRLINIVWSLVLFAAVLFGGRSLATLLRQDSAHLFRWELLKSGGLFLLYLAGFLKLLPGAVDPGKTNINILKLISRVAMIAWLFPLVLLLILFLPNKPVVNPLDIGIFTAAMLALTGFGYFTWKTVKPMES